MDTPLPPQHQHRQYQLQYQLHQHQRQHQHQSQSQQPQHDHPDNYRYQHRNDYDLLQKYQQEPHLMELVKGKYFHNSPQCVNPPRKRKQQPSQSTTKRATTKFATTAAGYSSTNNTQYTHSDQVNAQLLKEFIRQAGRNAKHPISSLDPISKPGYLPDLHYTQTVNGNYHHNPPLSTAYYSSLNRYSNIPYKIQTNHSATKKPKQPKLAQQHHHPYQRSANNPVGKPSMYSSDISQAQLLEIQAISRAQQDFIRAREQQEAEKGLLMKHHSKKAAH
ncbi:hypothetical protein BD408DRAFT_420313 [Parasitella parasitica]|nr:hypothetical protein BD408DRAFT_420313 [Parasitella parasitica]